MRNGEINVLSLFQVIWEKYSLRESSTPLCFSRWKEGFYLCGIQMSWWEAKLICPTHWTYPPILTHCSVSDGFHNPESSKRKITYFLDVSSQISTYSDFCSFAVFFFCFSLLLLKAFFFIANFLLPGSLVQYGMCVGLKFWSRIYGPAMAQMIFYFCLFNFCLG